MGGWPYILAQIQHGMQTTEFDDNDSSTMVHALMGWVLKQ
jgi:hypothetical protein